MEERQKELERWVRQQKSVARDEGALTFMELTHLGQTRHDRIWSAPVEVDTDPTDLASALYKAAVDDANGLGGIQKYSLGVCFGGKKKPLEKCRFRVRAPDDEEFPDDIGSEVANAKGLVTQAMRHTEGVMRTSIGGTQDIIRHYQKMVETSTADAERLRERLAEMYEAHEEILSMQTEREIDRMRAQKREDRIDEGIQVLKLLGPTIINKLAGKKILEEKETPESYQMRQFMESLDPKQMEQLSEVLKPAQLGVVLQLADKYLDEDKDKANGKALPSSAG